MIRTMRDILVVADMDGTLLDDEKVLRPGNVETIRLFTALGGRFSIATGRTPESVAHYNNQLFDCLSPCITTGGGIVYDYQKGTVLANAELPWVIAKKALVDVMYRYPSVGVMISCAHLRSYQLTASAQLQKLLRDEHITYFTRPQDSLPKDWNKVLFAGPAEMLAEVAEFITAQNYPGIQFVYTDPFYLEMMPVGVGKGSALAQLCGMLGIPVENSIVLGDYYNDIDMMKVAGHSVAMANAPKEVQMLADEVTGHCNDSGVGQYLYKLIKTYMW